MRAFLAALIVCLFAANGRAEIASCYGRENHQVRTATGAAYDPWRLTAAHRSLPFGTRVRVCNLRRASGLRWRGDARERATAGASAAQCVIVTINDRGPYVRGRDIDLSLGACRAIGNSGLARVSLQVLGR